MKLLFDLNVWIDVAARPNSFPHSFALLQQVEASGHTACLPLCGYTTIHYVIGRLLTVSAAGEFMRLLKHRGVRLLPFTSRDVALAATLPFRDHEDACVAATALNHKIELIITRNPADFKRSPVEAITPGSAIKRF